MDCNKDKISLYCHVGNLKRFIAFMTLYTIVIVSIVAILFAIFHHPNMNASGLPELLSISESINLIA